MARLKPGDRVLVSVPPQVRHLHRNKDGKTGLLRKQHDFTGMMLVTLDDGQMIEIDPRWLKLEMRQ